MKLLASALLASVLVLTACGGGGGGNDTPKYAWNLVYAHSHKDANDTTWVCYDTDRGKRAAVANCNGVDKNDDTYPGLG